MKFKLFQKSIYTYLAIAFLVAVFSFTHLSNLGSILKGLHADEASFLLNAYSLVHTQRDEDGNKLPIWFGSLIDSKPALYSYLQAPFVAAFGPTTTASRIPAAVLGGISILLVYWVLQLLLPKNHAAIVSLLLLVSPWHIIVSRSTQEVILAFVFSLLAIGAYLNILQKKERRILWGVVFILANAVAMYSYHSAKVFLPLLFVGWSFIDLFVFPQKKSPTQKSESTVPGKLIHAYLTGAIFLTAVVITFAFSQSLERFKSIGFLHEQGPQLIMEEQIRTATGASPILVMRVFYNKIVAYGLQVLDTYTQHYTINFLFLTGGEPTRYAVPFHGLFYHIEVLLLPLGIFLGLHSLKNRRHMVYMLWWFIVAPVPAALTALEIPSMIRAFPLLIPALVFIVQAMLWIWSKREFVFAKIVIIGIIGAYAWGFAYYAHQIVVQQPRYHPWNRNIAETRLAEWLVENQAQYDRVHISAVRDIYMYLVLSDTSLLPALQNSNQTRMKEDFAFDKYVFRESSCTMPVYPPEQKTLYVVRSTCEIQLGFTVIGSISYEDNATAYHLLEYEHPLIPIIEE